MQALDSSHFEQSYCIFISAKSASFFAEKVKAYKSVKVLRATFDPELAVIVIPNYQPFDQIEKELFDQPDRPEGGFWGQYSIGYKEKTWTVVD